MRGSLERIIDEILLPYQLEWLRDESRFKIGLWARQTGKDFTCMCEAVVDCVVQPGALWVILAGGERQGLETLAKGRAWSEVLQLASTRIRSSPTLHYTTKSTEISWSNGSRIVVVPARPETARGYSGNVILTEFAFHEDGESIWRAIYPTITNPLAGPPRKLRIISTPNGCGNRFHQLWTQGAAYSKHFVTIHDAIRQGLALNAAELQAGLNDPDGWAQEYECEFRDSSNSLLPYELIQSCESADASESYGEYRNVGSLFVGIDFGRKRDRTVCWTLEALGDVLWTREILVLENMETPDQRDLLRPRLERATLGCLDHTGPGVGLGDYLVGDVGEWTPGGGSCGKLERCQFTAPFKAELFPRLRAAFEGRLIRIPPQPVLREDLHGLRKHVSSEGGITYRADRTPDGHSDRGTALALALRAAAHQGPRFQAQGVPFRSGASISPRWSHRSF